MGEIETTETLMDTEANAVNVVNAVDADTKMIQFIGRYRSFILSYHRGSVPQSHEGKRVLYAFRSAQTALHIANALNMTVTEDDAVETQKFFKRHISELFEELQIGPDVFEVAVTRCREEARLGAFVHLLGLGPHILRDLGTILE